jgi:4-hydroxybenzoate polyprenyltransferase
MLIKNQKSKIKNCLLFIAFTQYLIRYTVFFPAMQRLGIEFQLSGFTFLCLVISTMCIAASGYAKEFSKTGTLYIILYAAGMALGCYAVSKTGINQFATYIATMTVIWFYAFIYKRWHLISNIAKALFHAIVPMLVLLDIPPLYGYYHQLMAETGNLINFSVFIRFTFFWIPCVAVFIFMLALSREIMEDTENFERDVNYDTQSLPFIMGAHFAKWTIIAINMAVIIMLVLLYIFYLSGIVVPVSLFYILLLIVVPLITANLKIYKAVTDADYRRAGKYIQFAMLAGIAYSGVLWLR